MKLHLPVRLFRAVVALFSLAAGITTTLPQLHAATSDDAAQVTPVTETNLSSGDGTINTTGEETPLEVLPSLLSGGYANGTISYSGYTSSSDGGAISGTDVTLSDYDTVRFSNNTASKWGGAIMASNVALSGNCTVSFSKNEANYGGAIYGKRYGLSVTLNQNEAVDFSGNTATYEGGAIYVYGSDTTVILNENESVTFSENTTSQIGGAIRGGYQSDISLNGNGTVTFSGNLVSSTKGGASGGAIFTGTYADISLDENETVLFERNGIDSTRIYAAGGAICGPAAGTVSLNNNASVTFSGNFINSGSSSSSANNGGAISAASSIELNYNETVTFDNNYVVSDGDAGATGGAIHGSTSSYGPIELYRNGVVTFSGNYVKSSSSSGYASTGGAISGDSSIDLNYNKSVIFDNNYAVSDGEDATAYGGAIYATGDLFLIGNTSVTFSRNHVSGSENTADGGAIYGLGRTMIFDNGAVSFSENSASSSGGAICGISDSAIKLFRNESVTFNGNSATSGGAICGTPNCSITLSGNGSVTFSGNSAEDGYGGAIYARDNLSIRNNDSVEFAQNAEYRSTYRLRSIYAYGGSGAAVSLSAAEGKSITFRDAIYIGSGATVELNADYTDAEGNTIAQKGDILFTGATTEADLLEVKGSAGTVEEILNSRTTEVYAMTNVYGGRLRVEDGAVYVGRGIILHEGSEATLRVKDATLNHAGCDISLNAGTTLELEGCNTITTANLAMQEGSILHFVTGEINTENAALSLTGTLSLGGDVTLSVEGDLDYGVYKLMSWTSLSGEVSQLNTAIPGHYEIRQKGNSLDLLVWQDVELNNDATEWKLSKSAVRAEVSDELIYSAASLDGGYYQVSGSGSMGVNGILSVTGGAELTLDVDTSAVSVEVGDDSSLSIRKGLNLVSLMTLADEESSTESAKAISVGSNAELSLTDASLLGQVSLADESSEVYYQTEAGDKLLLFSGELGSAGLNLTTGEDGKTVSATDSSGFTGNITVLSGTTLVNAVAEEGYNTAFGDTYDQASDRLITVQNGATLNLNGRETYYRVALETGAVLGNSGGDVANSWRSLPVLDVLGNAEVNAAAQISMVGAELSATSLNLNGHTLTKSGAGNFELRNTTVGAGTLAVNEGVLRFMDGTTTATGTTMQVNTGGRLWISEGTGSYEGKLKVNGGSVYLLEMPSSLGGDNLTDAQALDLSSLSSLELAGGLLSFRGSHLTLGTVDVTADSTLQLWDQDGTNGAAAIASTIETLNANASLNLATTWKSALDINVLTGEGSLSVGSSREQHTVNIQDISNYTGSFAVSGSTSTLSLNLGASDVLEASRILLQNDSRLILKGNGALNVAEGQILNAAGISVATDSGVLLKGSGTYRFGDMEDVTGSAAGMSGVTLGSDWTGRVLLENVTTLGIELDDFGGAGKTIDINGVSGWFDFYRTVESHLRLGENGLTMLDSSRKTYTYTGGMSGSGDFTIKSKADNTYTGTYDLSGKLSAWDGAFRVQQSEENANTPTIVLNLTGGGTLFSGAEGSGVLMERLGELNVTLGHAETATTMQGAILNTGVTDAEGTTTYGSLNLTANHTVSFNNTVQATSMTLGAGADVYLNGTTTLGTLSVGDGANLTLGKTGVLSMESCSGTLELAGQGVYELGTQTSMASGVTLGSDWTGSVRLTGATLAGETLAGLSTEQSTVELYGVSGYLSRADHVAGPQTYTANLKLTNNGSAVAWNMNNGWNNDIRTFSGDVSGEGTLLRDSYKGTNQTLIFTGNTSGWTGILQHAPGLDYNAGTLVTTDVTFSGTAELNVALLKNDKGEFYVTLDDEHLAAGSTVTVNKEIQSTTLAVTEGTTAILNATATQDTTTLSATEGGTATLSGVKASAGALEGLGEGASAKDVWMEAVGAAYGITGVAMENVHFSAALATLTLTDVSFDAASTFSVGAEGSIVLSGATLCLTLPEAGSEDGIYRVDLSNLFQCTVEGDLTFDVDTEALVAAGYTGVALDFGSDADEDYSNLALSMAGATYEGSTGNVAGFTLTTVPEPATATLSLLALAALAARRRRG